MAINSLYPGFWKIFYTSGGHQHVMTVPVKPVEVGGVWLHEDKNGNQTASLTVAATAFITAIKTQLHTTGNFDYVELWTMASPSADAVFREAVNLNIAGTSATTTLQWGQAVYVFRTVAGGLYRLYLMEPGDTNNIYGHAPWAGGNAALETALTGINSYVAARDGSYLASLASKVTKTNDALRKKYLLNA